MKLSLAFAVLMLVFAAYAAAEEETIEQKFATFATQMKDMTTDLVEKSKTTLEQIHGSDFAVNTRNWFSESFEKLKEKMQTLSR